MARSHEQDSLQLPLAVGAKLEGLFEMGKDTKKGLISGLDRYTPNEEGVLAPERNLVTKDVLLTRGSKEGVYFSVMQLNGNGVQWHVIRRLLVDCTIPRSRLGAFVANAKPKLRILRREELPLIVINSDGSTTQLDYKPFDYDPAKPKEMKYSNPKDSGPQLIDFLDSLMQLPEDIPPTLKQTIISTENEWMSRRIGK